MEAQAFTAKSGVQRFRPVMSEEEYMGAQEDYGGFCVACGKEAYGVEPDARRYVCESCDQPFVYGYEELLTMGLLKLAEVN
jgi:hypothetical protein